MRLLFGFYLFLFFFIAANVVFIGLEDFSPDDSKLFDVLSDSIIPSLLIASILTIIGVMLWRSEAFFQVFFGLGFLLIVLALVMICHIGIGHATLVHFYPFEGNDPSFPLFRKILSLHVIMGFGLGCLILAVFSDLLNSSWPRRSRLSDFKKPVA